MLATRQEYECQITDMSLCGMHLRACAEVSLQTTVVAYVDHFGRLQGKVVRKTSTGFAVALDAVPTPKRERLANTLTWLANRGPLGTPEDRCHQRIVPTQSATTLETEGEVWAAQVSDFSRSGAAVLVDRLPKIDARVVIGRTTGRVVRQFEGGVGVEFLRLIPSHLFDENYVL